MAYGVRLPEFDRLPECHQQMVSGCQLHGYESAANEYVDDGLLFSILKQCMPLTEVKHPLIISAV